MRTTRAVRTITAAAQQAASAEPYVRCVAENRIVISARNGVVTLTPNEARRVAALLQALAGGEAPPP